MMKEITVKFAMAYSEIDFAEVVNNFAQGKLFLASEKLTLTGSREV